MLLINPCSPSGCSESVELNLCRDEQGRFFVSCSEPHCDDRSPSVATLDDARLVFHVWYREYARDGYTIVFYEDYVLPRPDEDRFARAVDQARDRWKRWRDVDGQVSCAWRRYDATVKPAWRRGCYKPSGGDDLHAAALCLSRERAVLRDAYSAAQRDVEARLGVFPVWERVEWAWSLRRPVTLDMSRTRPWW